MNALQKKFISFIFSPLLNILKEHWNGKYFFSLRYTNAFDVRKLWLNVFIFHCSQRIWLYSILLLSSSYTIYFEICISPVWYGLFLNIQYSSYLILSHIIMALNHFCQFITCVHITDTHISVATKERAREWWKFLEYLSDWNKGKKTLRLFKSWLKNKLKILGILAFSCRLR